MKKFALVIISTIAIVLGFISCDDKPYHIPNFSTEWSYDETHHWHQCLYCDEKQDFESPKFSADWTITEDEKYKICSICNMKVTDDTIRMTLEEFNSAKKIPNWVNNVIIENINLTLETTTEKEKRTVIGNKNIADFFEYKDTKDLTEEDKKHIVGTTGNNGDITALTTDKKGFNLILKGGTVTGEIVGNPNEIKNNSIRFEIPNKSQIIFDGVTFENTTLAFFCEWQQISSEGYDKGIVFPHITDSITFKNCTFDNSAVFQNGGFAKKTTFDSCTFTLFDNIAYWSSSNPIWFINIGSKNDGWVIRENESEFIVKNCIFTTTRPIKLVEQKVTDAKITIIDNTFNLSEHYNDKNPSENKNNEKKNDVIMFSITEGTLGDVLIENNTVTGDATGLLTFYQDPKITMKDGASFVVQGNTFPKETKKSVIWSTDTEFTPDFVQFL